MLCDDIAQSVRMDQMKIKCGKQCLLDILSCGLASKLVSYIAL